ncbi:MAG: hypothetical protein ACD_60C00038G0006 [uncultured bacterium]|nr:MAG: hypothetical protein ACD_60C00038G0006 [uncultured bacterium]
MNKFIFLTMLFIPFVITSCFSPVKTEPQSTYVLNTLPLPHVTPSYRKVALLVMRPEANSLYRTKQMAYTLMPYQIAYYAHNSWAERPSDMLQPLIVKTLQNTRHFYVVLTPASMGHYDYVLNTEIEEFLQNYTDYTHYPGVFYLTVRAQITNMATNKIIATQEFSVSEPIYQETPYAGVAAANTATKKLLRALADFCVRNVG